MAGYTRAVFVCLNEGSCRYKGSAEIFRIRTEPRSRPNYGDGKQHGTLRQLKLRGLERADLVFALTVTAVNLRRLPKLFAESG